MFATLYGSGDVVSTSYAVATIATLALAALALVGLTWTSSRWRVPLALSAIALLAAGLAYLDAGKVWLAQQQMTAAMRYAGWFTVVPLQVAAAYFFARCLGPVGVGVFWRITVAAILLVLTRYLGDAGFFNPTLGVLLSMAFWLYILGEMYFGAMAEWVRKGTRPVRLGWFWMRLIMTIGWAIYPVLHFVDVVIGVGQAPAVLVLYNVSDLFNLITVSMIVLAVAGQESY